MLLKRLIFRPCLARLTLALMLICVLLMSQLTLNRHVVEHTSAPALSAVTIDSNSGAPDSSSCLVCLEYQAHGAGLPSTANLLVAQGISPMEAKALPPNTPFLAPERARQRAPPVLS